MLINSKSDLINIFSFANQKFKKSGITKGTERFFEFSTLLFLKLISGNNLVPDNLKWDFYKGFSKEKLLSYINDTIIPAFEQIFNSYDNNPLFTKLITKDPIALKQIIEKLDAFDFLKIDTDIKGDAFEFFIAQYNTTTNDLGEYFTPRHIVDFMVKLANPQKGENIYDPFCGTGGMLISAYNHAKECSIYANEISSTARIAKMNMILSGADYHNIKQQDTLLNPINQKMDVVMTNIPFNLEGVTKNIITLSNLNSNSQCLQHIINSLNNKPTARAYIIVPDAVLNNPESLNLRKSLIHNHLLKQIISLPSGIFFPYTAAKGSILVLQGFDNLPVEKIKYTIIKNDGYTLTQRRRNITDQTSDLETYLIDNDYNTKLINVKDIQKDINYSLIWFKYFSEYSQNYILLIDILKEERIPNTELYETATITKNNFFGILTGEEYWGESFSSVTSELNDDYKVVNQKSLAYNPARANIGAFAINITEKKLAVSKMYVTFKVTNPNYLPEYVYLCLKSKEGQQKIKDRCFGTVRQVLRFDDLCTISIPDATLDVQKKFVNQVNCLYQQYTIAKRHLYDMLD